MSVPLLRRVCGQGKESLALSSQSRPKALPSKSWRRRVRHTCTPACFHRAPVHTLPANNRQTTTGFSPCWPVADKSPPSQDARIALHRWIQLAILVPVGTRASLGFVLAGRYLHRRDTAFAIAD